MRIIFFVGIIILVVLISVIFYNLYQKYKIVFGHKSLKEYAKEGDYVEQNIPKSVSSMTSLCLPCIVQDFPDFNWTDYKLKMQNTLKASFLAISKQDLSFLPKEADKDLRNQIRLIIHDGKTETRITKYDSITIYCTEIISYNKTGGTCVITMQSAVGYYKWQEQGGKVINGSKEKRVQTKYNTSLIYVQDEILALESYENATSLKCPNCAAPIKTLGQKFCEYCGSAIVEYIDKVWYFGKIEEVKK